MQKIIERSSYSVHSMLQRCVDKWIDRAANFPVLQSGGKTPSNRSPTEDLAGSGKRSRSNSIDSKGSKRLVNSRTKDLANISDSRIIEDLLDQSKDNCLRNSEDQSTKVESNLAKKEFNSPMMDSLQAWKTVSYFDNISLLQLISDCGVGTDRVREYELAGNLFLEEVEANHTACGKLKDRSQVLMEGLVLLPSAVILNHYFTSAEYHSDFLASISKRDVAKTLWSATLTSYVCIKYEEASRATQALFYRGVLSTDVLPTKRAIQAMTLLTMRVNHESLGSSSNFNEFKRENSSSQVFIPAYSQAMCSLFGSLVLSAKETGLAQFVCCQSLRTELLLSCRLMSLGKPLLNETEVLSITPKKTSCGRQTSCSIHTWRYVDWKQHMHNCLAGLAACNSAELANHTQFLLQSLLLCSKDIDSRHKTFRYLHTSRQQIPQLCFQKEEILLVQQDLFYLSEILREAHPHPAVIDQSFVQFISSAPELIHNYREIICEPLLVLRFTADALRSPTVVRVALAIFLRAMQASRIHFRQQRILGISTIKTDMKVVNSRLHVLPHVDDVLYFTVQQTMAVMLLLELCLEMQAVNSIEKPVIRLLLDAVRDLLVEESVGSAAIQLLTANQLKKGHVGALMAHEELQQLYTEQLLRDITDKSKIETCNLRIFEKNLAHCVHFLRNNHVYCNENLRLVAVNIPGYVFRVYNHFTVFHHSGVTGAVDNLVQELLELSLDQYPSMAAQLYELAIGKVALSTVHVRPITSSNSGAASQTPWFGSAVGIKRLKERIKNTINLDALHSRHSLRVYTAAAAAFLIGQSTVALEAKVDSDRNISNNQDSTATYPFNEIAKPTKKRSRKSMQDEDSDDDSISDNEKRKKTESAD